MRVTFDQFADFVARGQRAQQAVDQIVRHGAGPTFSELAIGELFWWPDSPRGPEPMVKMSETRYGWSRGYGTAELFYRVERYAVSRATSETSGV